MKISFAHIADIHLGNYPGKVERGGLNSRFIDFVKTYNQSINRIIDDKIDFCLIPGDIFRHKNPSPDELDAFAEGIIKLQKNHIPTIVILGNHDVYMAENKSHSFSAISKIFEFIEGTKDIKGNSFILSTKPEIITLLIKGKKIQLQTMPYPIRSILKLEKISDVEEYTINKINEIYESRDKSLPILFAGHFTIRDASVGGEQVNFDKFADPVIPKNIFLGKDYLYVAMGHLHKYQMLMEKPMIVYCGSNNRVDFNEANEDKGFVEVFIDGSEVSHKFIKVDARKFIDLKYAFDDGNPTDEIIKSINSKSEEIKDAVVRINATIPLSLRDKYDEKRITEELEMYCYHIHGSTSPIIKKEKEHREISGFKESMTAIDALKHYAEVRGIKNKELFLEYGEKIIKEHSGGITHDLPQL